MSTETIAEIIATGVEILVIIMLSLIMRKQFLPLKRKDIKIDIMAGAALSVIANTLTILFPIDGGNMNEIMNMGSIAYVAINTLIIAPVMEELIFRGLIAKITRAFMTKKASIEIQRATILVISAFIFGIMHESLEAQIAAMGVGAIFCIMYMKENDESKWNLWNPIIAHATFNATSFLIENILY